MSDKTRFVMIAIAGGLLLSAAVPMAAQDGSSLTRANMVITGYGSAMYEATVVDEYPNNFTASVSPIFLYSMGGDVLFETELEFGLSGEATTTTLEYAQLDYLGFENVIIIAGKFLVPFGVFGERLHPTWINKLPTAPLLYGHAHGGVAEGSLLPVLSDAGIMARYSKPMGSGWGLKVSAYVTQGPVLREDGVADDGHDHEGEGGTGGSIAPTVGFGVAFADNNKNKMVGGRLALQKGASFELTASAFHAMYDEGNYLGYNAHAVSATYRTGGFEFIGEGVHLEQEFELNSDFPILITSGYYLQLARRIGQWEPVVRWSKLLDGTIDGDHVQDGTETVAFGLNYWIDSTIPVKLAYEYRRKQDDRLLLQWAFGF